MSANSSGPLSPNAINFAALGAVLPSAGDRTPGKSRDDGKGFLAMLREEKTAWSATPA